MFYFLIKLMEIKELRHTDNKYHYTSCKWAHKIKLENLIRFKTTEEAQRAEYIPCKICRR